MEHTAQGMSVVHGSNWSCAGGGSEAGAHSGFCLVEATLTSEAWALCITDSERGISVLLHEQGMDLDFLSLC